MPTPSLLSARSKCYTIGCIISQMIHHPKHSNAYLFSNFDVYTQVVDINIFWCFPVIQVKKCVIVLLITNFPIPSNSFRTQNSKNQEGHYLQTFQERGQTSFSKFQNFAPPTFYLSASYYMHGKIPCLFASLYYASRIWLFPPSSSPNQEMQNKKVCTIQGWRKV